MSWISGNELPNIIVIIIASMQHKHRKVMLTSWKIIHNHLDEIEAVLPIPPLKIDKAMNYSKHISC